MEPTQTPPTPEPKKSFWAKLFGGGKKIEPAAPTTPDPVAPVTQEVPSENADTQTSAFSLMPSSSSLETDTSGLPNIPPAINEPTIPVTPPAPLDTIPAPDTLQPASEPTLAPDQDIDKIVEESIAAQEVAAPPAQEPVIPAAAPVPEPSIAPPEAAPFSSPAPEVGTVEVPPADRPPIIPPPDR